MPENEPQNSNTTVEPTPVDSGGAPTSTDPPPAPAAAQDTGFRYTAAADVPDWAVGKTAKEVAVLAGQLYAELKRGEVAAPQPAAQPQPPAQPGYAPYPPQPAAPVGPQPPTEDDWQTDPRGAAQKQADYMRVTQLDPVFAQQATQLGQQSRTIMEMKDPDAFKRWGPEIDILINQVDPTMRTVETIRKIVGMVKSDHLDELVSEGTQRAIQKAQESGGLRSDGSVGDGTSIEPLGSVDFDKEDLPENYRRILSRYGVTSEKLDEFLIATEIKGKNVTLAEARKTWLAKAKKGDVLTEEAIRL